MRLLHVGWGFSPWRPGGLIAYAEDLMETQARRGHDVAYFCAGRHYPRLRGPRLKRRRRGAVRVFEVVNPPVVAGLEQGTREPWKDLSEPWVEGAFAQVLSEVAPDVVHFQELHGLPSALLDVAADAGSPTLMTLQDYFPLCCNLRLFDPRGGGCASRDVGAGCVVRNACAPDGPHVTIHRTIEYEKARARRLLRLPADRSLPFVGPLLGRAHHRLVSRPGDAPPPAPPPATLDPALAPAFQRRRDVNVERLGRVGRLVAQSPRVEEIYRQLGVPGERMTTVPFTLRHIAELRPRRLASPPQPVTFGTLNGCVSPSKGSRLVLGALRQLRAMGLDGRFRLRVHGYVDEAVREELAAYPGVELRGFYAPGELEAVLMDVDVGLMPSVWEEALGYTGLEMVAMGIPLIANPLGGIVQYAREGETAWLNEACTADGLAERMAALVRDPGEVLRVHRRLLDVRDEIVVSMDDHADVMERLYGELAGVRAGASGSGDSRARTS